MSKTSYRENIAKDIVSTLRSIKSIKFVSREIFQIDELSDAQIPAVLVQSASELKADQTIGHNRLGTVEYVLTGFVKGKYLDTARNKLADEIETQLYVDASRNGYAIDTLVTEINTDEGVLFPLGAIQMIVRVEYYHTAGDLNK